MTGIKIKINKGHKYIKIQEGDRYEIIKKYIIGKNVLDFGCVDHDWEKAISEKKDFWLHGFICRYALKCVGVDIYEDEIKKLNKAGYTSIAGSAENIDLGRKFDVIVAGELMEHLYNPGLFLENVKRHLNDGGVFLISTPNPLFLWKFMQVLIKGAPVVNEDHTCWFDPKTLAYLMTQHGFIVEGIYFTTLYNYNKISYLIERISGGIRKYFSSTFLIVARVMEHKI